MTSLPPSQSVAFFTSQAALMWGTLFGVGLNGNRRAEVHALPRLNALEVPNVPLPADALGGSLRLFRGDEEMGTNAWSSPRSFPCFWDFFLFCFNLLEFFPLSFWALGHGSRLGHISSGGFLTDVDMASRLEFPFYQASGSKSKPMSRTPPAPSRPKKMRVDEEKSGTIPNTTRLAAFATQATSCCGSWELKSRSCENFRGQWHGAFVA